MNKKKNVKKILEIIHEKFPTYITKIFHHEFLIVCGEREKFFMCACLGLAKTFFYNFYGQQKKSFSMGFFDLVFPPKECGKSRRANECKNQFRTTI